MKDFADLSLRTAGLSLIKSLDFDKPAALAASWKAECLVSLIVNRFSYETTPFFSHNDSSSGNRCDTFLRELVIMYHRSRIGDIA
ncbi:hypothetical protein TNCV_1899501 [Trichonephila clavipes]|nr:hypothetical protein TNCV_1899501 [Trichonephila clavipes]